jgi:Holliday junction resolvasome RuvABC DNA-binding subunit
MLTDEIKLPDIEDLSILSGLPESIMASDMVAELQKELVRMGKPEKEAAAAAQRLIEAFAKERERAVEACYLAGYLKGMSNMAQRVRQLLESRGEMEASGEIRRKVA